MTFSGRDESDDRPQIPDHTVHRCIGEGGYGRVWLARTVMGVWRAVKTVDRDAFESASSYDREFSGVRRFEPLSRSHEGFVDILQTGEDPVRRCFHYIMELADDASVLPGDDVRSGLDPDRYRPRTLSEDLRSRGRIPAAECVEIGWVLADALAQLHREHLIHRDIKPANIVFVGGRPKLADIGLVIDVAEAKTFVGTEGYVAPEGPNTAQADLYSLGIVLYEAATGMDRRRFPSPGPAMREGTDAALLRELNAVLLRACATRREDRYATAADMAADLALLRSGGSVQKRQRRQNRVRATTRWVAVMAAVVASVWMGSDLWQRRAARQLATRVNAARSQAAGGVQHWVAGDLGGAAVHLASSLPGLSTEPRESETQRIRLRQILNHLPRPVLSIPVGAPLSSIAFSRDGRLLATGDDSGSVCVWNALDGASISRFSGAGGAVDVRFSADGRRLLVAPSGGYPQFREWKSSRAVVLDPTTGKPAGADVRDVHMAVFSPDEHTLAVVGTNRSEVRLVSADTGAIRRQLNDHRSVVGSLAFSPDGSRIAIGCHEEVRSIRIWKTGDGLAEGPGWSVAENPNRMVFSPRGDQMLVSSGNNSPSTTISILDLSRSRLPIAVSRSPDPLFVTDPEPMGGRLFVLSDEAHGLSVRSMADGGKVLPSLLLPSGRCIRARIGPDGSLLGVASDDGWARVWDIGSGTPVTPPLRLGAAVHALAFSPDGTRFVTGTDEGLVRVWDLTAPAAEGDPIALEGIPLSPVHPRFPYPATPVADDGFAAILERDGAPVAQYVDTVSGQVQRLPNTPGAGPGARILPGHRAHLFASLNFLMGDVPGWNDVVLFRRGPEGWTSRRLPHPHVPGAVCFTPDDSRLVTFSRDGKVRVWRTEDGSLEREVALPETNAEIAAVLPGISADARVVFWADFPSRTSLFHAHWDGPQIRISHRSFSTPITSYTCHPTFPLVAVRTSDHRVHIVHLETGAEQRLPGSPGSGIFAVSVKWSPTARQLLLESDNGRLRVLDLDQSREYPLLPPPGGVTSPLFDFSPDGRWIVASHTDGQVWVADAHTGEPVTPWIPHSEKIRFAGIDRQQRLITCDGKGVLRRWDLKPSSSPAEVLLDVAERLSGRRLRDGHLEWRVPTDVSSGDRRAGNSPLESSDLSAPNPAQWHRARTADAESIPRWESARFHAAQLAALTPSAVSRSVESRLSCLAIPPRAPETPATALDLTRFYTHSLDMLPRGEFRSLPRGLTVLDGIPFDIRGLVRIEPPEFSALLNAQATPLFGSFPVKAVNGLPVGRPCRRIHLLHGVEGRSLAAGEECARWRIRFADGTDREFPVVFGRDLSNEIPPGTPPHPPIVWSAPGGSRIPSPPLHRFTWINPEPSRSVEALDFMAGEGRSRAFVVAITVD